MGISCLPLCDDTELSANDLSTHQLELTFEFYCRSPQETLARRCTEYNLARIITDEHWEKNVARFCTPEIFMIVNNKVDCCNAIHRVYTKLREFLTAQDARESYEDLKKRRLNSQPPMMNEVLKKLKDQEENIEENGMSYADAYILIRDTIKRLLDDEKFSIGVISHMAQMVNPEDERFFDLWNVFHEAYPRSGGTASNLELPELFSKDITAGRYTCNCAPLSYSGKIPEKFSKKHEDIRRALTKYLIDQSMLPDKKLEVLTNYAHKKAKYDHGIMGAHILLYTACAQEQFSDVLGTRAIYKNCRKLQTAPHPDRAIVEGVGAILVHNIYADAYKEQTGISFMLTLDKHPLAF